MRLLLDANLAVLLVVGLADPAFIARHKRLQRYGVADFRTLTVYLRQYDDVGFIPNTLTEVSNLAVQGVSEPLKTRVLRTLADLIAISDERYVESVTASARPEFLRLGLTDAALLEACGPGVTLLTSDEGLFIAAGYAGLTVQNFSHFGTER